MKRVYIALAAFGVVLLSLTSFFVFNNFFQNPAKQVLTIHCATSLLYPLERVEADFEQAYPDVDVQIEGHGTIQVIRHVTELHKKIDLIFVADYVLIPRLMYETKIPDTNEMYADYYIRFATNKLVLAYTDLSRYADEINSENWYSILTRENVKLGMANPQLAAVGYYSLIAIQLAEDHYTATGLFHDLITVNMEPPVNSIQDGQNYNIYIPEVQQPRGDKLTLRGSEVDLIGLLKPGFLDYCFIYLSNAKQYGFNYIELPDEINMGSIQHKENYERVQVLHEHQRFATVNLDRIGDTIYYGMTIPKNTPNKQLAETFVEFVLNGEGKADFEEAYHPVFNPAYTDNIQALPSNLQALVDSEP